MACRRGEPVIAFRQREGTDVEYFEGFIEERNLLLAESLKENTFCIKFGEI